MQNENQEFVERKKELILRDLEMAHNWQLKHAFLYKYFRICNLILLLTYFFALRAFHIPENWHYIWPALILNIAFLIIETVERRYLSFYSDAMKNITEIFMNDDPKNYYQEISDYEFTEVILEQERFRDKFKELGRAILSSQIVIWYIFLTITTFIFNFTFLN